MSPLRWGILSTGQISSDWVTSFRAYAPTGQVLQGVAARKKDSASRFASEHEIPHVFESYEALVKDSQIDIVYIGSVHTTHLWLAKLALENGKHVLCEKPLCVNTRETKELLQFAKEKELFLMEAIWSRFFPAYEQLREELRKGTIGEVYQVNAGMGVRFEGDNWRGWNKEICAGSVLDIGTYTCQFATLVFGTETPEKIIAGGHMNEHEVDVSSSATIIYSKGRTATLQTHMEVEFPNEALIIGTKGILKIGPKFWCPTQLTTPTKTYNYEVPDCSGKKLYFWNTQGLAYQCDEVKRCIDKGLLESPLMSHADTLALAEMREEIRKQIGVFYAQD